MTASEESSRVSAAATGAKNPKFPRRGNFPRGKFWGKGEEKRREEGRRGEKRGGKLLPSAEPGSLARDSYNYLVYGGYTSWREPPD